MNRSLIEIVLVFYFEAKPFFPVTSCVSPCVLTSLGFNGSPPLSFQQRRFTPPSTCHSPPCDTGNKTLFLYFFSTTPLRTPTRKMASSFSRMLSSKQRIGVLSFVGGSLTAGMLFQRERVSGGAPVRRSYPARYMASIIRYQYMLILKITHTLSHYGNSLRSSGEIIRSNN